MRRRTRVLALFSLALLLVSFFITYAVIAEGRGGILTISFLNIGQGDAIFIEAPSGRQVLVDGGPDSVVLRELSKKMHWYDRSLDIIIGTHPDADHIGGLIDIMDRYSIARILYSGSKGDTELAASFLKAARDEGEVIVPARGDIIELGGGAYLEILFPDRDGSALETNTGCIVARLVYGETSFMLSCDAPHSIEKYLVRLDGEALHSDVLKAGHHGSRTSSSELFVGMVQPDVAVISRGCTNRYGHPHKEVLELFQHFNIETVDTCEEGTVTFISDGRTVLRME